MLRLRTSLLLLAALAIGCAPTPGAAPKSTRTANKPAPSPSTAAPVTPDASVGPSTAPSVTPSTAPSPGASIAPVVLPANPTLTGLIQAPSSLIGNNGGNLIGNNGSSYRLLATAQSPLANATVKVLDAAGQPVLVGGQALVTRTDAQGRYGFEAALPDQSLILEVALPDGKGTVQAIAPKPEPALPRLKTVDADLVSTLTTGYILSQYVKGQEDPIATLDKLPGTVEQETRTKAQSALAGGTTAVPDALTTEKVVATVTTLRSQNAAFNDQLETVKKLLIAAGLSDFGNGLPATQVNFGGVRDLAVGPDGTLYISQSNVGRIWKLTSDGRVVAVAGQGAGSLDDTLTGKRALDAQISAASILFDPAGRMLLQEYKQIMLNAIQVKETHYRISRLNADGTLEEVMPMGLLAAVGNYMRTIPGSGDTVYFTTGEAKLWRVQSGQAATEITAGFPATYQAGPAGDGKLLVKTPSPLKIYRYDPVADTATDLGLNLSAYRATQVSEQGHVFGVTSTGRLDLVSLDGTTKTIMTRYPLNTTENSFRSANLVMAPDGSMYYANSGLVYRVADGTSTLVAGTNQAGAGVGQVTFNYPTSATLDKDGNLLVADKHQLIKVVETTPSTFLTDTTSTTRFSALGRDGEGRIYALDALDAVRQYDPTGTLLKSIPLKSLGTIWDLAVAQDGTLYVGGWTSSLEGAVNHVARYTPGSATPEVIVPPYLQVDQCQTRLAVDPKGGVYVAGDGVLRHWSPTGGARTLKQDTRFVLKSSYIHGTLMVADAQGRLYLCGANAITRYDPAADTFTAIAGPGGKHFTGTGVDDSLSTPCSPFFAANGDLYVVDVDHKQIKRIPAAEL